MIPKKIIILVHVYTYICVGVCMNAYLCITLPYAALSVDFFFCFVKRNDNLVAKSLMDKDDSGLRK